MLKKNEIQSSPELIERLNSQDSKQIVILSFAAESLMNGTKACLENMFSEKSYTVKAFNLKTLARQKSNNIQHNNNDESGLTQSIKLKGDEIKSLLSENTIIYICCHGYANDTKNCYAEKSTADQADITARVKPLFTSKQLASFIKQMLGDDLSKVQAIKLFICYGARTSNYKAHHIKDKIDPTDSFLADFSQEIAFDNNHVKITGYTGPARPDTCTTKKLLIGTEHYIFNIYPLIGAYHMKSEKVMQNAMSSNAQGDLYTIYFNKHIKNDDELNKEFNGAKMEIRFILDEIIDKAYEAMPKVIDLQSYINDSLVNSNLLASQRQVLMLALESYFLTVIAENIKGEAVDYYSYEYGEISFIMENGKVASIEMFSHSDNKQEFYYQFERNNSAKDAQQNQFVAASFAAKYKEEYNHNWEERGLEQDDNVIIEPNANNNSSYYDKCTIL